MLFNGCTGIMAGANLSGDLEDASKAIPKGTLAAFGFTYFIYLTVIILTAATCTGELLRLNYPYLQEIAAFPPLVIVGIFAATLSAGLTCLIGASRVLQAVSKDNLLGDWFSFFSKEKGNPVRAVLMSWLVVQGIICIGVVNAIAPLVSMLYLITYAMTNFACFALAITGAPNFRPRFTWFTWHTALFGFFGCVGLMFYVGATYAAGAIVIMLALFLYIHFRHVPTPWGDVSQALIYHQVRKYLLRLEDVGLKYWRPQIMLLTVNPRSSLELMRFANDLKKGGLYIVGRVLVGDLNAEMEKEQKLISLAWNQLGKVTKVKLFANVAIAPTVRAGVQSLLTVSGLGGMRPNIVLMGMFRERENAATAKAPQQRPSIATRARRAPSSVSSRSSTFTLNDQLMAHRKELLLVQRERGVFEKPLDLKVYDNMTCTFPELPDNKDEDDTSVTAKEYVGILNDVIVMNKNIGVCRHMRNISGVLGTAG